ncbi:MAG TPA: hypothetical protein VI306_25610 [Pyrinomonadaceae bacterium]
MAGNEAANIARRVATHELMMRLSSGYQPLKRLAKVRRHYATRFISSG